MGLALVVGYLMLVLLTLIVYECRERRLHLTGEAPDAWPIGAGHQRHRLDGPGAWALRGTPKALASAATVGRRVGAGMAVIGLLVGGVIAMRGADARSSIKLAHGDPVKLAHVHPLVAITAAPSDVSPLARADIPPRFLILYMVAGRRYGLDWSVLAAVGKLESNHGRSRLPGVSGGTNAVGAAGPMQFLPATWRRYGAILTARGQVDVYDPADAVAATANYLRASGAPGDWPGALYAYNHSSRYVRAVLALAARYKRRPPANDRT